jgi:beta-glucosidase
MKHGSSGSVFQAAFRTLIIVVFLISACSPNAAATPAPAAAPTAAEAPTAAAPTATATVSAPASPAGSPLAPDGKSGEIYYAPFPVTITLDGKQDDWNGVPRGSLGSGDTAMSFAYAADAKNIYILADVTDKNIISGKHEGNFWNEDSVEFEFNGTGNFQLENYVPGVAQVTIPTTNIGNTDPAKAVLAGINGTTVNAQAIVVKTDNGYLVEASVPLKNNVWDIAVTHGTVVPFNAHLNGASTTDRDTILNWSALDLTDSSYQNPGVFAQLIFYEVGQAGLPVAKIPPTPIPEPPLPFVSADAPYRNPKLPVEERVDDLLARMALVEKIGQMTQVEKNSMKSKDMTKMYIGSILSGGGGYPTGADNSAAAWSVMVGDFQDAALRTRLHIPMIYGVDAVHGHNNLMGAVIFPHNIGLGAANDPELMKRIGEVTAAEMIGSGVRWNFAPVLAVGQDIRWGRIYESYGENTDLVTRLSTPYVQGLQGKNLSDSTSVLATIKHFIGDGGTSWGSATQGDYKIDQGVTEVDEATLRKLFLPPYVSGIKAGARSVMVSFSSWGGMKMHAQKYLITDVLKGEMGFTGFVVSDWGGIDQVSPDYYNAVVTAINAGVDMNMVPTDYKRFIKTITQAVEKGDISMERIDDATRRILRVKFEMGLFEHPYTSTSLRAQVGSPEHRAIAQEAVSKSVVLLKNDNQALPVTSSVASVYVGGVGANDIGMQSGGWTIEWQGKMGAITPGTTILDAIQKTVSAATKVTYSESGKFDPAAKADVCFAVVGEQPYAEGVGDRADLSLSSADIKLTENMRAACTKLIVILISGRPMMVTDQLPNWDGFVAAWLPGTEGQGVADVLFGKKPFTGKLSFTWPRSNDQLPLDLNNPGTGDKAPLFPYGFGLSK